MTRHLMIAAALAALAACSPPAAEKSPSEAAAPPVATSPALPSAEGLPGGAYTLDKSHSTLVFRVNHIGFSNYTARFDDWDAQLELDPANPSTARVTATINPRSLGIPRPPAGFLDELRGAKWLDVAQFPQMTFRSTAVESTGANSARITGDLTLHGITKPVTLDATFNGGYPGHPMDPRARIGFSAHGTLKRSDFGVSLGVPPPGTTMGVSDDVEIVIETEFSGPAWTPPPQAQEQKQNP